MGRQLKVLVTGSRGFIGQPTMQELSRRGHEAVGFDLPNTVLSADGLSAAAEQADAIIHLAGMLGTAETIGVEWEAAQVNIQGTLNVLDVAADRPVVLIGTGHKGQMNPYAITKGAAEDLALSRVQWTGAQATIVRAYHVYGSGQKASAPYGQSPVRKIFPTFACQALTGAPLQVWGTGHQLVDMVWVGDVASVLVDAAENPRPGAVVQAGCGNPRTVRQVAADIIQAARSESTIEYLPMRPGEPVDARVYATFNPACPDRWDTHAGLALDYYRKLVGQ